MSFQQISGHRRILGLLSRAAGRGTLPQSLIFAGPKGVGKRAVAFGLAQALNCEHPVQRPPDDALPFDACGACGSCRRIARGIHADVLVLQPGETGSIKINDVRDAILSVAYRPFEGRRRVLIVDDADALGVPAQNALLKTLEEPPPASTFVLITARSDMLLPTVRSRCPRLRFGPLKAADVAAVLTRVDGWTEAEAMAAAATADGSVARAIAARDDDLSSVRTAAQSLLDTAAKSSDPRRLLDAAKDVGTRGGGSAASEREELATRLHALASVLRDLGILSTRADVSLLANADVRARLDALTDAFDAGRAVRAFSAVDRALVALERNASPKIVADWLALQL